jgi:hypothetical protein
MSTDLLMEIAPFCLTPIHRLNRLADLNSRPGYFIRLSQLDSPRTSSFSPEKIYGYSQLMTWPELGDEPVEKIVSQVRNKNTSSTLWKAAFSWAAYDLENRQHQKSPFGQRHITSHLQIFSDFNHTTLSDLSMAQEFLIHHSPSIVKIKAKLQTIDQLIALIKLYPKIKWRWDFNGEIESREIFEMLKSKCLPFIHSFDFWEDPFSFKIHQSYPIEELKQWLHPIPLALDRMVHFDRNYQADVHVLKPIQHQRLEWQTRLKTYNSQKRAPSLVVTSNMDHPLGHLIALAASLEASQINSKINSSTPSYHGLLTHDYFGPQILSTQFFVTPDNRLRFQATCPYGWGFKSLDDSLNWESI